MNDTLFYNVWHTPTPESQARLIAAMRADAPDLAAKPGFRSLTVLLGEDNRVLVEGRWASREAFDAAVTHEGGAQASRQGMEAFGTPEPGVFTESFRIGPAQAPRSVVRISLARFDAARHDAIRQQLDDSQATLVPAIKALKGHIAFYAAIDRENCTMSNVSVWETLADARQLDTLQAMIDLQPLFVAAGARFERPITNHETLWVA